MAAEPPSQNERHHRHPILFFWATTGLSALLGAGIIAFVQYETGIIQPKSEAQAPTTVSQPSSLSGGQAGGDSATSSSGPKVGRVFKQYTIRIEEGWSADLDKNVVRRSIGNRGFSGADVRHSEDPAFGFSGESGPLFAVVSTPPSVSDCEAAIADSDKGQDYANLDEWPKGTQACIVTDQGRLALLTVVDVWNATRSIPPFISLHVIVWDRS